MIIIIILLIIFIILLLIITNRITTNIIRDKFKPKVSKDNLNLTLKKVANILNKNNIKDWFIGYGTLLGITRNNSCIDNDDDVDIVINRKYKKDLKKLFKSKKIVRNNFLQFKIDSILVDFYLCNVIHDDFHDSHENTIWKNCKPINYHKWNGVILNIPNNPEVKLKNRYGEDWKIPKNSKGNTNYVKNAAPKLI